MPIRRGRADCCAAAISGQKATPPPRTPKNSLRLMSRPPVSWDRSRSAHRRGIDMSALGQKQTLCGRHVRFTPKQTCPWAIVFPTDRERRPQNCPLKSAYQFAPKCDRRLSIDQRTLVENCRAMQVLAERLNANILQIFDEWLACGMERIFFRSRCSILDCLRRCQCDWAGPEISHARPS